MDMRLNTDRPDGLDRFLDEWYSPSSHVVAYTSGSTGTPKKIELPKSDMRLSAEATCTFFGIDSSSHLLLPLSVDYIAGKMMVVRAIVSECRLTAITPSNRFDDIETDAPIDLAAIVPSQIEGLCESSLDVKNVIVGGAPLSLRQEKLLADSRFEAYATYGMTETCSHVALRNIRSGCGEFAALPGIEIGVDERGCLTICSDRFSYGRIVTNDLVEMTGNNSFRWLGRCDNVINSGGIKIIPELLETKIAPAMDGRNFYVTWRSSDKWGQEVVLVVEGDPMDRVSEICETLPRHMRPKAVYFKPELPRTPTGKIRRIPM